MYQIILCFSLALSSYCIYKLCEKPINIDDLIKLNDKYDDL